MVESQDCHMTQTKQREMETEWRSWQHLIKQDIERLEYRIQCVYAGMVAQSIPHRMREPFVQGKLVELIADVTKEG